LVTLKGLKEPKPAISAYVQLDSNDASYSDLQYLYLFLSLSVLETQVFEGF